MHGSTTPFDAVEASAPPPVLPILSPPFWAGDRGSELVELTAQQDRVGIDDPATRNVDPLGLFTDWFGPGDRRSKPVHVPSSAGFHPRRVRVFRPSSGARRLAIDRRRFADHIRIAYTVDGETTSLSKLEHFDLALLPQLLSMREFARRLKQDNKPVATWLHTIGHHVGAESHHERSLMMIADFHPAVHFIAGQPFTMLWPVGAPLKTHTPDVMVMGPSNAPMIVDVRTPEEAADQTWVRKVPAIADALRLLGLGYAIWTGMSRPFRRNLENLTEASVPAISYDRWSRVALDLCDEPMPATELADRLDASGYQRLWSLTLIRRMLWRRVLLTDMFSPYSRSSTVWRNDA